MINGKEHKDVNLKEYLDEKGYDINRIAVEINGEILPKSKYRETTIKSNDNVEIVSFVGGG
ncbi:MAG: sulfur carrier protein ThiS [Abditibacteriota bacterium]|nr:sulfur carrier protein ThiS [Abditibacteriota bacterium]